jgi:CrcB protein
LRSTPLRADDSSLRLDGGARRRRNAFAVTKRPACATRRAMRIFLLVFFGAGFGGVLRHFVNSWSARWLGGHFPWGILTVNVTGSFMMGLIAGYLAFKAEAPWSQPARLFLTTGMLGGYTTFSAFSLDAATLIERGQLLAAGLYVGGSVGLAIGGLFLGLFLMRSIA